tara:strand:+ start:711 stop:1298 length:588 start_codon:yes stop_codon:yes gene_type:complete
MKTNDLTEHEFRTYEKKKDIMLKELKKKPENLSSQDCWKLEAITPQIRGHMMENRHVNIFSQSLQKVSARMHRGDFKDKNEKYYEYKFSVTDDQRKLSFLQIRLSHKVDYFIFEVYDKEEKNFYSLLIPYANMVELVNSHGSITHGSSPNMHSLRPSLKTKAKNNKLWKKLTDYFSLSYAELERHYDVNPCSQTT